MSNASGKSPDKHPVKGITGKIAKRRKQVDKDLLKTVASEILTDTASQPPPVPEEDEGEVFGTELDELTGGQLPPPPPDHLDDETTFEQQGLPPVPEDLEDSPPPPPDDAGRVSEFPNMELISEKLRQHGQSLPDDPPPPPQDMPDEEADETSKKKPLFKKKLPLGEILVLHHVITHQQLDYALAYQREHARDQKLGEVLFKLKLVTTQNYPLLINALMTQLKSAEIDLTHVGEFVDFSLAERLKLTRLEKDQFFPLRIIEDRGMRTLEVFIENDADLLKLDELAAIYSVSKVRPVGKFDKNLLKTLFTEIQKGKAAEIQPDSSDRITVLEAPDEASVDNDAIQRGREDNYISRITNKIIYDGVKLGASDIHVEYGEIPRVRYRVDGLLQEGGWISTEDYPAVISRLKIMSELDISERRVPQDGNIRLGIEGMGVIDFRVNTIPVSGNEKVCLRILDGQKLHDLTLDQIGLPEPILESYIDIINRPQGMVLITGPTGSGKSTTLYSSLIYLLETRGKEMNICTAEDPIEYKLEGLNQTQLNEKVGLTFPKILKALLRQDPDIILVGEIRDLETAGLGVKASQTGHLVLSTLHTNTAIATVSRLVNMGVEAFMVADTVLSVMNQRLARRICPNCAEPYTPDRKLLAMIPPNERDDYTFLRAKGCPACNYRGYKGRIGLYEYLRVSRDLRRMIINGASEEELLYQAREENFLTLREYGLLKVKEGLTTLDEVASHTIDPFE